MYEVHTYHTFKNFEVLQTDAKACWSEPEDIKLDNIVPAYKSANSMQLHG